MQRSADRLRTLAAHGAILSDPRLPTQLTDLRKIESLEGRVLGHAEDEMTGRVYMILEGTDHVVHFIYHTLGIEAARQRGNLKANSFVRFSKQPSGETSTPAILDLGDSEKLLTQKRYLTNTAQALLKRGIMPVNNGWAGWLGRYDEALVKTAAQIQTERSSKAAIKKESEQGRSR